MLYKPKEFKDGFVPDGPGLGIDWSCTPDGWPHEQAWTKEQCEQICIALGFVHNRGRDALRIDFKRLMNLDGFA